MGEVELEDNVLVIRRIHVVLKLKARRRTKKPQIACTVSSPTNVRSIAR